MAGWAAVTRVLVTGGTGTLGGVLVPKLEEAGYAVRVMSRRASQLGPDGDREWARADLQSGDGLSGAVADVDVVVHAATSPLRSKAVDVRGTERLLAHAADADVSLFVYVSIVGVDAWESLRWTYYGRKLTAEAAVASSDVPTAVLRATQFHPFVDGVLRNLRWSPVWLLPTEFRIQPVPTGAVADRLVDLVVDRRRGRAPDVGGPEVLTLGELAAQWKEARGVRRPVVRLPIPGTTAARLRDGAMTAQDGRAGTETWREWLDRTAGGD